MGLTETWLRVEGRLLAILSLTLRPYRFRIRTGLARGMLRRFGPGFRPRARPSAEERFLLALDWNDRVVYDVGAFVGMFTLFFARSVGPRGRVVAFEPDPRNYDELVKNVALNGFSNVLALPMGLSNRRGAVPFALHPWSPARGTVWVDRNDGRRNVRSIQVQVDMLDRVVDEYGLPPPGFVKIDVEGHELDALLGMRNVIDRFHPDLLIEVHAERPALREWLLDRGYTLLDVEAEIGHLSRTPSIPAPLHVYCRVGSGFARVPRPVSEREGPTLSIPDT